MNASTDTSPDPITDIDGTMTAFDGTNANSSNNPPNTATSQEGYVSA
jgi:hypothetical protein